MQLCKVRVESGSAWKRSAIVRLPISVGAANHEGEAFVATLKWLATLPHIEKIYVNVCDTLQRHNLMRAGLDAERAMLQARAEGALWLARNEDALELNLTAPYEIVRWDYWLNHTAFPALLQNVEARYEADRDFHKSVEQDIASFLARFKAKNDCAGGEEAMRVSSKRYILEETAIREIQQIEQPACDIYPGTISKSMKYLSAQPQTEHFKQICNAEFTRLFIYQAA